MQGIAWPLRGSKRVKICALPAGTYIVNSIQICAIPAGTYIVIVQSILGISIILRA